MSSLRRAATVILVRPRSSGPGEGLEVFLVCRHRGSGFMANAYVFPGGIADDADGDDLRVTAARELFEEAGVLLCREAVDSSTARQWRDRAHAGEDATAIVRAAGNDWDLDALHSFAHWVTPSAEKRRYSARFYVAHLPAGQEPRFDNIETVDETWVTPEEGLARAGALKLPPPQVRTLFDMQGAASRTFEALQQLATLRAQHDHPILPRIAAREPPITLLFPWDPDYLAAGSGDSDPITPDHYLANGPTRIRWSGSEWKQGYRPE